MEAAIRHGSADALQELLTKEALDKFVADGSYELLCQVINPRETFRTKAQMTKLLVNAKADANAVSTTNNGLSVLNKAVEKGQADVVQTLVDAKANVSQNTKSGHSSLLLAVRS